jgi:DNA-binding MarR family transcriptional regulator
MKSENWSIGNGEARFPRLRPENSLTMNAALGICSCSAVRQAARHLTRLYDDALAPVGTSLNQYSIMSRLSRLGPQKLQDLADLLVMDRSTLGHLLRPLERRGLVTIRVSKMDKRQRAIALSNAGKEHMKKAKRLWNRAERSFEHAFGADRALSLRTVLKQVIAIEFDLNAS